jgi:hypothetical protein
MNYQFVNDFVIKVVIPQTFFINKIISLEIKFENSGKEI